MCGIVAIWAPENRLVPRQILEEMTNALAHRGPDDFGYAWICPATGSHKIWKENPPEEAALSGILFGHRRLSILDLTSAGRQPCVSDDGTIILAYNGEIYNYVELRRELEASGVVFRNRTDTEVLLLAYREWGIDALNRFNGMWAFVLWDARRRRLIASRDRFGIKPLYYTVVDGILLFASEQKALLKYPGAHKGFRETGITRFMAQGLVDHTDQSLFNEIYSIRPGHFLEFHNRVSTQKRYWQLSFDPSRYDRTTDELTEEFGALLYDAVRIRTRSDVQIGTMLSGGLDSTTIAAFIDRHRTTQEPQVHNNDLGAAGAFHETFTACWPGEQSIDEEEQVGILCADLGLRSERVYPKPDQLFETLESVTYSLDEPFETPVCAVQWSLMKAAKERGVKVVLNGHGSDEILAGYPEVCVPAFLADQLLGGRLTLFLREFRRFSAPRQWSLGRLVMEFVRGLAPATYRNRVEDFVRQRLERRSGIFRNDLLGVPEETTISQSHAHQSMLTSLLSTAFTQTLIPQWLRMEDRVSMAHSVESRLPFMDYRLVEFGLGLPSELKLHDGYTKYILRKAVSDLLPRKISMQKHKQRFATPYARWMRGPWRPMVEDLLLTGSPRVQSILQMPRFQKRLREYLAGSDSSLDLGMLWRILHTEIWMRAFSK